MKPVTYFSGELERWAASTPYFAAQKIVENRPSQPHRSLPLDNKFVQEMAFGRSNTLSFAGSLASNTTGNRLNMMA